MSLLKFSINSINNCPELILSSEREFKFCYDNLYLYYKNQEKIFPIKTFLNMMFQNNIMNIKLNKIQYEVLSQKIKKISIFENEKFRNISKN